MPFLFRLCLSILHYRHPTNSFLLFHTLSLINLFLLLSSSATTAVTSVLSAIFCVFLRMLLSGKNVFALETHGQTRKQGFRNINHTWEASNVSEFGNNAFTFSSLFEYFTLPTSHKQFLAFPHSLAFNLFLLLCSSATTAVTPYFQPFFVFFLRNALVWKKCFRARWKHMHGQTRKQGFRNKNRTWETSNVSEFGSKQFCFPGSKFCFRNIVSMCGQTGKHLRKHHESHANVSATMFPSLPRACL